MNGESRGGASRFFSIRIVLVTSVVSLFSVAGVVWALRPSERGFGRTSMPGVDSSAMWLSREVAQMRLEIKDLSLLGSQAAELKAMKEEVAQMKTIRVEVAKTEKDLQAKIAALQHELGEVQKKAADLSEIQRACGDLPLGLHSGHKTHPVIIEPESKYQIVEHKDAAALAARVARPAPYKDFIFTTWQGGNIFTRFWWSHIMAVGLENHALMITYDRRDCHTLPVKNCVVHSVPEMLKTMNETRIPPNNGGLIPGAGLAVVSKWTWSLEFLKAGYNVLFADNDAAFAQNPLDYWWRPEVKHYDVMGLSDWRTRGGEVGYCNRKMREVNCQSTGIMYFRCNERTIASVSEMVKVAAPPRRGWEQAVWQQFIPRISSVHNGTYQLLPLSHFMNLEWVKTSNPEAVAVHMGYVHGTCNKIHAFWCIGLGTAGLEKDVEVPCRGATITG